MTDSEKDRLEDAADELQERGKEAMKQHGDLGGVEGAVELAPDPLKSTDVEADEALDNLKRQAMDNKRDAENASDKTTERDDF